MRIECREEGDKGVKGGEKQTVAPAAALRCAVELATKLANVPERCSVIWELLEPNDTEKQKSLSSQTSVAMTMAVVVRPRPI